MSESVILHQKQKKISKIIFNRSQARNAISQELLQQFQDALQQVRDDSTTIAVVITGSGDRAFCAGADLKERQSMSHKQVDSFLSQFRATLSLLEKLPCPVIAAMNGDAYGGGLEIALACDLRWGRSNIKMGLTETRLGIIPGAGGTQRLPRIIGIAHAKELIFFGKRISADTARQYGLLNRVLSADHFEQDLDEAMQELQEIAPLSLKYAKQAIDLGMSMDLENGLTLEREIYNQTLSTRDRLEGLAAFRDKRKPIFTGE